MRCDSSRGLAASSAARPVALAPGSRDQARALARRSTRLPRRARRGCSALSRVGGARARRAVVRPRAARAGGSCRAPPAGRARASSAFSAASNSRSVAGQRAARALREHALPDLRVELRDALGEHRLARRRVRRAPRRGRASCAAANADDRRARRRSAAAPRRARAAVAEARALALPRSRARALLERAPQEAPKSPARRAELAPARRAPGDGRARRSAPSRRSGVPSRAGWFASQMREDRVLRVDAGAAAGCSAKRMLAVRAPRARAPSAAKSMGGASAAWNALVPRPFEARHVGEVRQVARMRDRRRGNPRSPRRNRAGRRCARDARSA